MRGWLTALALAALPGVAHAEWYQATSKHFAVYAEGKPDALKTYISGLERYDSAMRLLYGRPDLSESSTNRVTIFVVSAGQVERLYGRGGDGIAGFYDARASGSVAFATRENEGSGTNDLSAQAVLFHEYAHHFMFTSWPNVAFPTWLIEGFAEYNAPSLVLPDGAVEIGKPLNYRVSGIFSNFMPARKLLTTTNPHQLAPEQEQALYGRGWLLLHYMLNGGRTQQLTDYINAVAKGVDSLTAAQKSFGDLGKLDRQLDAYAEGKIMVHRIPASALKVGDVSVRPLSPGEAAVMPALLRSKRAVDEKTAPIVAALAEKLAAPYPTDGGAQNELAEAEYDAGAYQKAADAATRAIAADPQSLHALIYRGMAEMALARQDPAADKARWTAVRHWFVLANKLDTENAEPLRLFYVSFPTAKQTPTKNAQDGLLYAQALAPFDDGLRLTAANVLLHEDKAADARTMLEPLAFNPHSGALSTFATTLIAAIDKGGTKAALAAMEGPHDAEAASKKS
jgi:tetratricopeptide (TPR) repeat protein